MLASELAQELGVDPSVISKRLNVYHAERGTERLRRMDAETAQHLRAADALMRGGKAVNFKQAILQVLGRYIPPVPSESAQEIMQRLDRMEAKIGAISETVQWMAEVMRSRSAQRAQTVQNGMNALMDSAGLQQE